MNIFSKIDHILNAVTMYRLILYSLIAETIIAFILTALGQLPFSVSQLFFSLVLIGLTAFVTDKALAALFRATTNYESSIISSLILFFVIAPITDTNDTLIIILASILTIASKYLLAINKKHIFNPVAIALFIIGLLGFGNAIWWAGSVVLLPFFALFGFFLVRKLRRFKLVLSFMLAAISTLTLFNLQNGVAPATSITQIFTSWPLVFFATVMLTEPLTSPGTKKLRVIYGAIIGVFFGSQFSFGPIFSSPEFALIIGNIFAYLTGSREKLFLTFKEKKEIAENIYEFSFSHTRKFAFKPGQYMEWTLPNVPLDSRGNRRYFTISSAPTEEEIKISIKYIPDQSSNFKKSLHLLKPNNLIIANQLGGDFVLPNDPNKKLIFVAGGIGLTPFRSMLQYLLDMKGKRDIVFFYFAATEKEFAYKELFETAAKQMPLKIVYSVTGKEVSKNWHGETGRLSAELIEKYCPDYKERTFYLSGPNMMVENYKKQLHALRVDSKNIITDYFPGF